MERTEREGGDREGGEEVDKSGRESKVRVFSLPLLLTSFPVTSFSPPPFLPYVLSVFFPPSMMMKVFVLLNTLLELHSETELVPFWVNCPFTINSVVPEGVQ